MVNPSPAHRTRSETLDAAAGAGSVGTMLGLLVAVALSDPAATGAALTGGAAFLVRATLDELARWSA